MNLSDISSNKYNKDKIAVVVVGYNRIKSIRRLMNSLLRAEYPSHDIPLVISIDCSNDFELYDYVQNIEWPYGDKYVNIQEERLGLKRHIYQCGDLTNYFKAIILLEDDLAVSPYFYQYTQTTLDRYGDESTIAQISLYKNEMNGYVGLPFDNLQNGSDVFLMQDVSTWGECWNSRMWNEFKEWRDSHDDAYLGDVDMPIQIKQWTKAWSKYYNAYVVDTNKYVLYPNVAVTTNFSDAGVHGGDNNAIVQVNLLQESFEYRLPEINKLARYDIYFNNESLYDWLNIDRGDLCLDIYGFNRPLNKRRYLLSSKKHSYAVKKSFALNLRPIELNVKMNISGNGLYLYDTFTGNPERDDYQTDLASYFLRNFHMKKIVSYVALHYKTAILRRIFRCKRS